MKKLNSLLRKEVTILGANGIFGKAASLLLKQSSAVKVLNLFDYEKVEKREDIESIKSDCKLKCHFGKEYIGDALKTADIIILSDDLSKENSLFNPQAQFLQKAPKIVDYASKIAACNSAAVVVVATSPINFTLPLMTAVLDKLGKLDVSKVLGMTNVDLIRANSVFASHLHVNPKSVWLPIVGGSSQETRVPLFSKARPSHPLSMRMIQKLTSEIKTFDLQIGAKPEIELKNRAYATVRLINAIMAGLEGKKGIMETVMSQQDVVKGTHFFSLPVIFGETGIQKRISLPSVSDYESRLLSYAIKSLQSDANKVMDYVKSSVDIEKLKKNSRINKLTNLEQYSQIKELNGLKNYINNLKDQTTKTKEKCSSSIKSVFSQKAEQSSFELKTSCAGEEKLPQERNTQGQINQTYNKFNPNLETMKDGITVLQPTISSVINTKNINETFTESNLPCNKDINPVIDQVSMAIKNNESEKTYVNHNVHNESENTYDVVDTKKHNSEAFIGITPTKVTPNLNNSLEYVDNTIKPVIFSESTNKNTVQKEFTDILSTINSKKTDDPLFPKNEYSNNSLKTGGNNVVEKINSSLEDKILKKLYNNIERKIVNQKMINPGRIPPPKSDVIEKTITHNPIIIQDKAFENEVRSNNRVTISGSMNESPITSSVIESRTNKHQYLPRLTKTDGDGCSSCSLNEQEVSLSFPNYEVCSSPLESVVNEEGPMLEYGMSGEDCNKGDSNELMILYPQESTENHCVENKDKENIETTKMTNSKTPREKANEKKFCPHSSKDYHSNTHYEKMKTESPLSENKSTDIASLKGDVEVLGTNNKSKDENMNFNEDTIKCQALSYEKQLGFSCSTLPVEVFKKIMPNKNILIDGQLFKRLKERSSYFPIMESSRFTSSEPSAKEVNGIKNNDNKKKPRAEEIWKFFKEKRNLVSNEKLISQEGPAATLLKKKSRPLTDIKLAQNLRRVNNDEISLTMKLQEKQKKLIMSMKNNNVSFDAEKAECPLTVKAKVSICPNSSENNSDVIKFGSKNVQGGKTTYSNKETCNILSKVEDITMRNLGESNKSYSIENDKNLNGNKNIKGETKLKTEDIKDSSAVLSQKMLESPRMENQNYLNLGKENHLNNKYDEMSVTDVKEISIKNQGSVENESAVNIIINGPLSEHSGNLPEVNENKIEELSLPQVGEIKIKEQTIKDSNNSRMEINTIIPTITPKINVFNTENHCPNSGLLKKGHNIKEEKALVPLNVSPVNCELSKIKC